MASDEKRNIVQYERQFDNHFVAFGHTGVQRVRHSENEKKKNNKRIQLSNYNTVGRCRQATHTVSSHEIDYTMQCQVFRTRMHLSKFQPILLRRCERLKMELRTRTIHPFGIVTMGCQSFLAGFNR